MSDSVISRYMRKFKILLIGMYQDVSLYPNTLWSQSNLAFQYIDFYTSIEFDAQYVRKQFQSIHMAVE